MFNIISNGNDFKLGFYGGNQPLSFTSTSSTYPPDFYYESSTGSIYMGNVLLKNIGANKTTLMIRIDSNYNFYIGTALNNYWLIGNYLTNMSIINNDTYTIADDGVPENRLCCTVRRTSHKVSSIPCPSKRDGNGHYQIP